MAGSWARPGNLGTQGATHTEKQTFVPAVQRLGSHIRALSADTCAEENGLVDALPVPGVLTWEAEPMPTINLRVVKLKNKVCGHEYEHVH